MYTTLTEALKTAFVSHSGRIAVRWREGKNYKELTFAELEKKVNEFAIGLISFGVKAKENVGLIADVSHEWSLGDFALQMIGAVDVPRGTDSTADELAFILKHAGCKTALVINTAEIEKIEKALKKAKHTIKKYIVLDNKKPKKKISKAVMLDELLEKGRKIIEKSGKEVKEIEKRQKNIKPEDIATIIYTSGTTGEPKGAMLTQANFASQLNEIQKIIHFKPEHKALTLLPPWHIFGRTSEYLFYTYGLSITYTDIKNIGEDMRNIKPTHVPAVPRIWEGVYNKIIGNIKKSGKEGIFNVFKSIGVLYFHSKKRLLNQERLFKKRNPVSDIILKIIAFILVVLTAPLNALGNILVFKKIRAATGGNLIASISGGGALPGHIDDFFAAIGINILEGYGLTETSPVISVRPSKHLVVGTVGPPLSGTEIKLIDPITGKDVTKIPNARGTLYIKGPQVMKGYYKNPKKTAEVIDKGWFNTGDLVALTVDKHICIVGRTKDTIVLLGGENIEPTPIEERLKQSSYIDQNMVVGQDKKNIGALIVPNEEELKGFVKQNQIKGAGLNEWIEDPAVIALYKSEISKLINANTGFKTFERISTFRLIPKPFEKGLELTNKLSVKRHVVTEMYSKLIDEMFK
ncbi:MAG: AMP-binding protein [Spirochaetia bacterium]|nr:AMP-binding protein [Spirochaetia bacterium]